MNIKRIAIIKGFNQETEKEEIEKIVIFYENGSVEVQDYNRLEHLRLIANYLFENGIDLLDDGLRKGMSSNLISIVNHEDELAMEALNNDISNAKMMNDEKTVDEDKIEENAKETIPLTDEFRELTRYFTLTKLRNRGNLTGRVKKDVDRAIKQLSDRNDRILAIEETRNQFLEGKISEESYLKVYEFHRNALREAIKAAKLFSEETLENPMIEPVNNDDNLNKNIILDDNNNINLDEYKNFDNKNKDLKNILKDNNKIVEDGPKHAKDGEIKEADPNYIPKHAKEEDNEYKPKHAKEEDNEYKPKHAKEGPIKEADPNYIPRHAKKEETSSEEENLSKEKQDLKDYLRLLYWDDKRMLPPVGQNEMREIEGRNEKARTIAEARIKRNENAISNKDFEKILNAYRAEIEGKTELDIEIERLSEEVNDLKRYIKLVRFDEKKQLSTAEQYEMREIEQKHERAKAIAEVRRERDNNNISDETFKDYLQKQRIALVDLYRELQEKIKIREEQKINEPDENALEVERLSNDVTDLTTYLKLLLQDEAKKLSPDGQKEMKEIEERNERAAAIAEARRQRDNNNLSDENFRKVVAKHRQDLNEEYRRLVELNRMGNTMNTIEDVNPEKPEEPVKDDNLNEVLKMNDYNKIDDEKNNSNDNTKNDNTNKLRDLLRKIRDEKNVDEDSNKIEDDAKTEPAKNEEEKGFILVNPEENKDKENKKRRRRRMPDFVINKDGVDTPKEHEDDEPKGIIPVGPAEGIPGKRVVGRIPSGEDDPTITDEVIPVDNDENKNEHKKVKVKKRNRVWAAILAGVIGLPLVGWIVSKLVPGTTKTGPKKDGTLTPTPPSDKVSPTPAETNEAASPTPAVTEDTTISDAIAITNSIQAYADHYNLPLNTRNFLNRADVIEFLSQFKNENQRNEVISALAFGYEMNYLTHAPGIFKEDTDKGYDLNSYCFDFLCAKAYVNGYTPEQMAVTFGTVPTIDQLENGFRNFYNMLATYSINGTVTPSFRYLTNGETKDCKAYNQLFHELIIVNSNRKNNKLTSEDTDNFIVACDKLYGRGSGTQFTTEGAAQLGMSIINGFTWGQANIAYGEALVLQEDHGTSRAGLRLSADENGHWEIDGFNYYDLYTQANKGWANVDEYNSRCYNYRQRMADNLEKARDIANGGISTVRETFADKIDDYSELEPYAEAVRTGKYDQSTMDSIYEIALEKYPHLIKDLNNFIIGHNGTMTTEQLVSIDKYAQSVDRFFLIGIRDNYDMENIKSHYVNQAYQLGRDKNFVDENGHVIGGNARTGISGDIDLDRPISPNVPQSSVTSTTSTVQVSYDDLTPAEKQEAHQQIQSEQQHEDAKWQQKVEHAQAVAQAVTDDLHSGNTSDEEARRQLEDAGIDVDEDYFDTMHQIHDEEVAVRETAEQEAREATAQSEREARERNEAEAQAQVETHADEEELIRQSSELNNQPNTASEPSDFDEIDPEFGTEDEKPYSGRRHELEDYRRLIAELKDFGITENSNDKGYTLKM